MKTEFVALSMSGVVVLFVGGIVLGWTLAHPDLAGFLITACALFAARDDARNGFVSGSYSLGWFAWRRYGAVNSNSALPHQVSA